MVKKADVKKLSDTSMMMPLYRRVVVDVDLVGVAVEMMMALGRRGGGGGGNNNRRDWR